MLGNVWQGVCARSGRVRRASLLTVAAGLLTLVLPAAPAVASYAPEPTSGWATDNSVFAIAVSDNAVFLGGKFTKLKDTVNGGSVSAYGLAALDRTTGQVLWTATTDNEVRALALSPDGTRLFVGGTFTSLNGAPANHLVAVLTTTGKAVTTWQGSASGTVRDLLVEGTDVYVAGQFGAVNGVRRGGLAKLDVATGAVQGWRASTGGGRPWAIAMSADRATLFAGGNFTTLGRSPRAFLGSVSTGTGQVTSWAPASYCDTCYVFDLDTDGSSVFAGTGGPGGNLTAYSASSGTIRWAKRADGNIQAVRVVDGLVYAGGHFDPNFAGVERHQLAAVDAATGTVDSFAPAFIKPTPGVWAITARPDTLYVGGGFSGVGSHTAQSRYATFPTQ